MRGPLDRSAAFSALLDLSPEFGETKASRGSEIITLFLADFYDQPEAPSMYDYAKIWLEENPQVFTGEEESHWTHKRNTW